MGSCRSCSSEALKVWEQHKKAIKLAGASVATALTGADPVTAKMVIDQIEKDADKAIRAWNRIMGNSSGRIGPRACRVGQSYSGTVVGPSERTFISNPMTHDEVTVRVKKKDGNGAAEVTICAVDENGRARKKGEFTFSKGKSNQGKSESHKVRGVAGKCLVVIVRGKSVSKAFTYSLSVRKGRSSSGGSSQGRNGSETRGHAGLRRRAS